MAKIQLKAAATVVCLRRSSHSSSRAMALTKQDLFQDATEVRDPSSVSTLFGSRLDTVYFESGWEVLMGQREVKNWMRSTANKDIVMRYPGEWNFPGGTLDPGETLEQAARRELEEEFMFELPSDARLRLISVKQTRAIRGTSNLMYNFVALADDPENKWLRELQTESINARLSQKRMEHAKVLATGDFWKMTSREKEAVAPEMRRFCWHNIPQAVSLAFTSMIGSPMVTVDEWQKSEFQRYGVTQRDFTFIIMQTCLDIESMPSTAAIMRSTIFDPEKEAARIQWLFPHMTQEEADHFFWERVRTNTDFKADKSQHFSEAGIPNWMEVREKHRFIDGTSRSSNL